MDTQQPAPERRARANGREAKRAARAARAGNSVPYITRAVPYYEVLTEEGLAIIERNADTILAEVGIEFREDPEALDILRAAGAEVTGELVLLTWGWHLPVAYQLALEVPAWHVPQYRAGQRPPRVHPIRP